MKGGGICFGNFLLGGGSLLCIDWFLGKEGCYMVNGGLGLFLLMNRIDVDERSVATKV